MDLGLAVVSCFAGVGCVMLVWVDALSKPPGEEEEGKRMGALGRLLGLFPGC